MMKNLRLTLVILLAIVATTAVARPKHSGSMANQWHFGLKAGTLISTIISNTPDDPIESVAGFTGGLFVEYDALSWLSPSVEVLYAMQGGKAVGGSDLVVEGDYISVPILANFYVVRGLALKVGVQPSFLVAGKLSDPQQIIEVPGMLNEFDLVIPIGVSYTCNFGLVIDARVNFGTINLLKDVPSTDNGTSFSTAITLGWKF
ncbi:MAG: outer membrane beta-barrel protein [Mucinivorans sp.]